MSISFEDRQIIKQARSAAKKARLLNINMPYDRSRSKKAVNHRVERATKRLRRAAKQGLILLDWDYMECTHCKKRSNKWTNNKLWHYANCPKTPIPVIIPDWLK